MIYDKKKLLELGGVRDSKVKKWDKKAADAAAQSAH
jgi:hypothetical protein